MTINYSATVQFSEEDSKIVNDFFQWADKLCAGMDSTCSCCPFRSPASNVCCLDALEIAMKENKALLSVCGAGQVNNYSLEDCTISKNKN